MPLTRRDFINATAAAAAYQTRAAEPPPGWFDRPMRWAQLTLVEDDPGKYDLNFWLDYFRRTHSDAACLSAGGCVAYYPTKIPLHYRSQWLADTDPFGDLVAGCRKLNMVVIARTDPHAAHQDVYDAHPDWIAVDADGKKRRHWAMPELWVTCALGPYNFEFMTEVTQRNRLALQGGRHLQQSLGRLRHVLLRALPREFSARQRAWICRAPPIRRTPPAAPTSPGTSSACSTSGACGTPRSARSTPPRCYIPNSGGGALSDLDMKTDRRDSRPSCSPTARRAAASPRPGPTARTARNTAPPWAASRSAASSAWAWKSAYRWKDSVQNGPEIRLWALDGIANGLRPWFTKFSGTLHDRRWLPVVEELYALALPQRALPAQ